jgi:hypothetical protein
MSKNAQYLKIEDLKALSVESFKLRNKASENSSNYQNNYTFACFNSTKVLLDKQLVSFNLFFLHLLVLKIWFNKKLVKMN